MLDFLNGVPVLGDVKKALDPATGYQTAAAGAKAAQGQANALSDLQWQRQMQGLQQATGYTNQLQSLYNSLYTPGHGQAAPGGLQSLPGNPGAGMTLASMQPPPGQPPPGAPGKSTQPGTGGWRGAPNSGGGQMNQAFQWLP